MMYRNSVNSSSSRTTTTAARPSSHPVITASSSTRTKQQTPAKPQFLEVIDPVNRTGKVTIPMQYVQETRGMKEQDSRDLSLCLLFQKGRCNAGSRCHQIHADPSFVNKLRTQASTGSACCALHGDFHSAGYVTAGVTVEVTTPGCPATRYSLQAFAKTQALDTILANAGCQNKTVRINGNKICRLHSQGRCKFGKDCKNIHLCPKAKSAPAPLSGFATPAVRPAPSAAFKSSGPLAASGRSDSDELESSLKGGFSRKGLAPAGLEASWAGRSDFTSSDDSVGGLTGSCPSTPNPDQGEKSHRSLSMGSSTPSASEISEGLSPSDSPKEKPFRRTTPGSSSSRAAPAAMSLFNRNCVTTSSPAPSSATEEDTHQPMFAHRDDAIYVTPAAVSGVVPMAPAALDVEADSVYSTVATAAPKSDSIWEMPLMTQAPSPMASMAAFEATMAQLATELSGLTCSPSWTQAQ